MNLKHRIYRLLVSLKQRTSRLLSVIIVFLAALFGLSPSVNAARWYVNGSLTPCGDGIGWSTAFKYLQDALNNLDLAGGDEIWVAATDPSTPYRPDQDCNNPGGTDDRELSFEMIAAVEVYGGFFGDELTLEERDIVANETILSGEIGNPGDDSDNSNHVVQFFNLTGNQAILDGFTIRDGTANGDANFDQHHGGGMLIEGEPSVVRCTFTSNTASGLSGVQAGRGDEKKLPKSRKIPEKTAYRRVEGLESRHRGIKAARGRRRHMGTKAQVGT